MTTFIQLYFYAQESNVKYVKYKISENKMIMYLRYTFLISKIIYKIQNQFLK